MGLMNLKAVDAFNRYSEAVKEEMSDESILLILESISNKINAITNRTTVGYTLRDKINLQPVLDRVVSELREAGFTISYSISKMYNTADIRISWNLK